MTDLIPDRIKRLVAREFGVDLSVVKDETHFRDHLGASDLDRVSLESICEDAFGVVFSDNIFEFDTVGDLIALIEDKLKRKAA